MKFDHIWLLSPKDHQFGCWTKNRGKTTQIIHFNRVFPYFHHPFWGFSPLFLVQHPHFLGPSVWNRCLFWLHSHRFEFPFAWWMRPSGLGTWRKIITFYRMIIPSGFLWIHISLHFKCIYTILGGGNSNIFVIFTPVFWGDDPIWRAYFSNGLKPPTSYVNLYSLTMSNYII